MSELTEAVDRLDGALADFREDYRAEAIKRDRRIRFTQIAIALTIVAALVGVAVGIIGIRQIHEADESRKQRTIAACEQANVTAQNIADASKANFDAFIDLIVDSSDQPQPKAIVDAAKKSQHDAIQAQADKPTSEGGLTRDCSPAGIAAYYSPKDR